MERHSDVVIVGSGPAGCSAATFLAQRGFEVTLLDKARFPRDKVCGDGLSASSLAVLDRMGATDELERQSPQRIEAITLSAPGGAVLTEPNPPVAGLRDYGYVVPRRELDELLFRHASGQARVTAIEGATVTELIRRDGEIRGVAAVVDGKRREFFGAYLLGADGVHSRVAKLLGRRNRTPAHRAMCVRAYFDGVEGLEPACEIHYERSILPGYGWIFPTGGGSANVGVGVGLRSGRGRDVRALFERFVRTNRFARRRLSRATLRPGTLRGWPIPFGSFLGPRASGRALLLGDAASLVDTLSGEGIYHALRSGELAARALIRVGCDPAAALEVGLRYELGWRRELWLSEYLPGFALQRVVDKPRAVDLTLTRAMSTPWLARALVGVIGHRFSKAGLPLRLLREALPSPPRLQR